MNQTTIKMPFTEAFQRGRDCLAGFYAAVNLTELEGNFINTFQVWVSPQYSLIYFICHLYFD